MTIAGCPTCGGQSMRRVRRDLKRGEGSMAYVVPAVAFEECRKCGEQLFDHEAMQKLEKYRSSPKRRRREAAKGR